MLLHFDRLIPSIPFILGGILVTLKYTLLSIGIGFVLGIFIALARLSKSKILSNTFGGYISIFRGTPLLVQLSIIYYATPQLTGYKITAFEAGVLTLSLNSAAYVAEIIRAGIQSVEKGQFEAATSLGLPYALIMRDIILPQAIKNILPALVNEMINLLKESALVSVIGEADLLRRAMMVAGEKFIYFEPLLFVAGIYYMMVVVLSYIARQLEQRLRRSDSH